MSNVSRFDVYVMIRMMIELSDLKYGIKVCNKWHFNWFDVTSLLWLSGMTWTKRKVLMNFLLNSFSPILQLLKQLKVFWNEKSGFEVNTFHEGSAYFKVLLQGLPCLHICQPAPLLSSRWGNITWVKAAGTLKKAKAQMSWKTWNFSSYKLA